MSRRAALVKLAQAFEEVVVSVKQLLDEDRDPNEWLDQAASPLGRRRHCELSRSGRLAGARKVGGHWLVRRRVIDAFIEAQTSGDDDGSTTEEAAILAFKAPPRRKGKGKR